MKVSALWITKNEEGNIGRSIKSVKDVADELIVVDTGSTDNTVLEAEELGARVLHFEWINDFSAAKNFALDHASGEILFFLDADEWFEPALVKSSMEKITRVFDETSADIINFTMHNLTSSGAVKATLVKERAFHARSQIRFHNKIHEEIRKADGTRNKAVLLDEFIIKHTGYTEDKIAEKSTRNLEILDKLTDGKTDLTTEEKFYLMRENYHVGRLEESFRYLNDLIHSKKKVEELSKRNTDMAITYFFTALTIAGILRNKVSRKEIHENLVKHMIKLFPKHPGSEIIELSYIMQFEKNDKKFLEAFQEYENTKKAEFNPNWSDIHKSALQKLYSTAANAELLKGNKESAMQYGLKAITCHSDTSSESSMKTFIRAVKGADETALILLLNSLSSLMVGDMLEDLLESLMHGYLKNVYLYFFKKQYDAGQATKARFLYLKILTGNSAEAVETALANREEMQAEDFCEIIFCAVICAGDYEFYLANKEYMGDYGAIAEAYFENNPIAEPNLAETMMYVREYRNITFAAGKEIGDRFLSILRVNPSFMLMVKCEYYMDGGLYEEFLAEEDIETETLNTIMQRKYAQCCVCAGRYERAFFILKHLSDINYLSYDALSVLWVVSENASGSLRQEAKALYDEYAALIGEILDLQDIQNTGIIFDEVSKKDLRTLASLTPQNFKKEMFNTPATASERVLDAYEAAADLYIEKAYYGMAERYLRKLLVSGHKTDETYAKLSEVYRKLGNAQLAEEFAKFSQPPKVIDFIDGTNR